MGGGWDGPSKPVCPPKEAVPEHLDRTSTMAGPSVVCLAAVRSGAVIGRHLGGGGTAERRTLGLTGGQDCVRALTVRGPSRPPSATPTQTSAAVALLSTDDERG